MADEQRLIKKIKRGDRASADALVRLYYDEIFCFIRKQAEDVALDLTVDYFRSRAARSVETLSLDDVEPIDEPDFAKRFAEKDFAMRVCDYVGRFPPDTQKIFRLHIFGGYTFAEIAEGLHMAEGSVKSKYYRLLNKLRGEFDDGKQKE